MSFSARPRVLASKTGQSDFTLIELLVVIAIIAILAAILFPVFGRARKNARRASCMNNMKQFGLAWMQYSQDYDELTIPVRVSVGGANFALRDCIDPYIKNRQVYLCPSEVQKDTLMSYGYNWCVATNCGTGPGGTSLFKNIAALPLPSQTPAFTEAGGTLQSYTTNYFVYVDNKTMIGRRTDGPTSSGYTTNWSAGVPRTLAHMDGCNYLFVDGHVKWFHYDGMIGTNSSGGSIAVWLDKAGYTTTSTAIPGPKKGDMDYNVDGVVGSGSAG